MFEQAEFAVYALITRLGLDTEAISDTGTVDNLLDAGFTLEGINNGDVGMLEVKDHICWLY